MRWCGLWCRGLPQAAAAASSAPVANPGLGPAARGALTLAYGLAGLGYIVTATFLPVIARAALPAGSVWPDLFWPLFGMGVAMGPPCPRAPMAWDRRWLLLLVAYLLQAGCDWSEPGVARRGGFALGSWLLGLPFTAITFLACKRRAGCGLRRGQLHRAAHRRLRSGPDHRPPMVAWTLHRAATPSQGFTQGLVAAAAALVLGAVLYAVMVWRWPLRAR